MRKIVILATALLAGLLLNACAAEVSDTQPAPQPEPEQAAPLISVEELEELEHIYAATGNSCVINSVDDLGLVEVSVDAPAERIDYGRGRYKVGTDLPADIYFLIADQGREGRASVKDGTGLFAKEIFHESFTSHTILQVESGQQLILENCIMIHLGYSQEYFGMVAEGRLEEGMYLVGYHIIPGGYEVFLTEGQDEGRVVSYADAARQEITREKDVEGDGLYTALAGQYIWLRGATMENIPTDPDAIHT